MNTYFQELFADLNHVAEPTLLTGEAGGARIRELLADLQFTIQGYNDIGMESLDVRDGDVYLDAITSTVEIMTQEVSMEGFGETAANIGKAIMARLAAFWKWLKEKIFPSEEQKAAKKKAREAERNRKAGEIEYNAKIGAGCQTRDGKPLSADEYNDLVDAVKIDGELDAHLAKCGTAVLKMIKESIPHAEQNKMSFATFNQEVGKAAYAEFIKLAEAGLGGMGWKLDSQSKRYFYKNTNVSITITGSADGVPTFDISLEKREAIKVKMKFSECDAYIRLKKSPPSDIFGWAKEGLTAKGFYGTAVSLITSIISGSITKLQNRTHAIRLTLVDHTPELEMID